MSMLRRLPVVVSVLLVLSVACPAAVWNCSSVIQIENATRFYNPGDEIIIAAAPSPYIMQAELQFQNGAVTMRGATGNWDDVILQGPGMNISTGPRNIIHVWSDDVTIESLTVSECVWNGIQIHGEGNPDRTVIRNVHTLNIGERHIKVSKGSIANAVNDVLIENCLLEQTYAQNDGNYIGGIDAMVLKNPIIRNNEFRNIQGQTGEGRAAIFLWQGIVNPTVEGNVIYDCDRGIAMGNPSYTNPDNLVGGIVRNNFVSLANEINLELIATTDLKVYNNTLYASGSSYGRSVSMESFTTSGLELINNLIYGNIMDRGIPFVSANNITGSTASASWFVDMPNGELHLTELAIGALDAAGLLAEVFDDIDGGPRPVGAFPDIGADEYGSPAGDADYDGLVDGLDYVIWSNNYGLSGDWGDADFSGDDLVDGLDYVIWSNNYGFGYPPSLGGAVPEPGTLSLLALASVALLRRRRRA